MFSGSIVALVTPFNHSDEVDYDSLKNLVEYHIKSGSSGIVAVGTTGESATLTVEEHVKVVNKVVKLLRAVFLLLLGLAQMPRMKLLPLAVY